MQYLLNISSEVVIIPAVICPPALLALEIQTEYWCQGVQMYGGGAEFTNTTTQIPTVPLPRYMFREDGTDELSHLFSYGITYFVSL